MESYRVWKRWSLFHDYFADQKCRGIELSMMPETENMLRKRGAWVRKTDVNEWVLLGSEAILWDPEDELVCVLEVKDAELYYFTRKIPGEKIRTRLENGEEEIRVELQALSLYWEYLLIGREEGRDWELELTELTGRLIFGEMEKTEVAGREAWRTVTTQAVRLQEKYDYRLRLSRQMPFGQKLLSRDVAFPQPGRYVTMAKNCVRQIIYY